MSSRLSLRRKELSDEGGLLRAACRFQPGDVFRGFWTGYHYWVYENNDGKIERGNTINCKRNARLAFEALKGKPQAYEEALKGAEYAKAEREIVRRDGELLEASNPKKSEKEYAPKAEDVAGFDSRRWAELAKEYGRKLRERTRR